MKVKVSNFSLDELCRTSSSHSNVPGSAEVLCLNELMQHLQIIRNILGCPLIVNSGFRSPMVNDEKGGVSSSFHVKGRAADIRISSKFGCVESVLTAIYQHLYSLGANIPLEHGDYFEDENFEVVAYPTFVHFAFKYEL